MKNILVPVDFSPASTNAAHYAAFIAKQFQASLLLFHAYMLPTPVSEVPYVMVTASELQTENEALIKKEAKILEQQYGIKTDTLVRIGVASDEIRLLLKEQPADLVVMGMKGSGGLEKIIGSTTNNVVRKVKVPVLIVPHDAKHNELKRITLASDFQQKGTHEIFSPLKEFIHQSHASLTILHVHVLHTREHSDVLMGKKDLEQLFGDIPHHFTSLEDITINDGLERFLKQQPSDMLVMVAHEHSFLERLFNRPHTSNMAYETNIPLLVLQDKG